jgi:stearoyl-CoA 9-desaturase NADPH oxidoreductase
MATLTSDPPRRAMARRLLRSPIVDLLLGPHGVDRYLELINPALTVCDARAQVVRIARQTPRSVTLTLRANGAWAGFDAGQFVRVGVEIDGVRRTRTYSPAGSQHAAARELELTVTKHPHGHVSGHLHGSVALGTVVHLGQAQGEFRLPEPRPERIVLISGGSGITPVLSMLRTLCDEGHDGEIDFLHYARTESDWLYEREVRALRRRHRRLAVRYRATRGGDRAHLDCAALGEVDDRTWAAACGPPSLIAAARDAWGQRGGRETQMAVETFMGGRERLSLPGDVAQGTLRFLHSDRIAEIRSGTLLEQAEAAGLSPEFGCRMGICHTCTCRKAAGAVRNVLTGEVSDEDDEDIQLCVSVPAGNVALEI